MFTFPRKCTVHSKMYMYKILCPSYVYISSRKRSRDALDTEQMKYQYASKDVCFTYCRTCKNNTGDLVNEQAL